MDHTMTLPALNAEEFNAVLAGLRALQYLMDHDQIPPEIREILTDQGLGLGLRQLDDLCRRLNCAEEHAHNAHPIPPETLPPSII